MLLLAPFAPYAAEELWEQLGARARCSGKPGRSSMRHWPRKMLPMVLQVNGKLRGRLSVPFGTPQRGSETLALADRKSSRFIDGKQVVKVIVVPDKLVNIVVK